MVSHHVNNIKRETKASFNNMFQCSLFSSKHGTFFPQFSVLVSSFLLMSLQAEIIFCEKLLNFTFVFTKFTSCTGNPSEHQHITKVLDRLVGKE